MKNELCKTILSTSLIFISVACSAGPTSQNSTDQFSTSSLQRPPTPLPTLHKIETHTFDAPYSCDGNYRKSAMFLSDFSLGRNSPDLLFNGACGSELYIQANTAGDDFALISDLGPVTLESVKASKTFNYDRIVGRDNTFKETMPVIPGNTYVVLISKSDIRALYALHIESITPQGQMKITYAVKSYSIQSSTTTVPGFDWEQPNQ